MLLKFRFFLLSLIKGYGNHFRRTWLRKIPGSRKVYYYLNEFPWLFLRKTIFEIEGSKMYLNPWERSTLRPTFRNYITSYKNKEPLTIKVFKDIVKEGYTVVDLGANIGYFTLLAARLVGNSGKVYSFEPEPKNYRCLCKNIELNGYNNICAEQAAVSNVAGKRKLFIANETGAHTIRSSHDSGYFNDKEFGEFVEVSTIVLNDFFDKDEKIDVIKMDIEGSEMAAFLGMDEIIRRSNQLKMIIEFFPYAIREMGFFPELLAEKLLKEYGFSILVIDELRTPMRQCIKVESVDELMSLSEGKDKIVNLFLER